MGREIYTAIVDPQGKEVWNSADAWDEYFCGRNEESTVIARQADSQTDELDFTDSKVQYAIEDELNEIQERADRFYNRVQSRMEDLSVARRNAATLEAFNEFSEALDACEATLHDENWGRGRQLVSLMDRTVEQAGIMAKSPYYENGRPVLNGYRVLWIVSE